MLWILKPEARKGRGVMVRTIKEWDIDRTGVISVDVEKVFIYFTNS